MLEKTNNTAGQTESVRNEQKFAFGLSEFIRSPAMGAFIGMLIVFLIFTMFGYHRNFLSIAGLANWMNFASTVGIIAIPVAFLMISGELDISTGAVMPASAMMLGISVNHYDFPMWLGIVSTLMMASCVGLINGSRPIVHCYVGNIVRSGWFDTRALRSSDQQHERFIKVTRLG